MALIKPMALIESKKKKLCMHSNVYFRTNKQTGATYSGKLCNPNDAPTSEAQAKARTRFAKVSVAVRAILADPTEKAKLEAEYKAQTRYGSLFGYAMHKLNSNYDADGNKVDN